MKKLFFIIFSAFILSIPLIFAAQYFLKSSSLKGALQVTSSPDAKVYLNDKLIGQTPLCKCDAEDMINAGEYTIRLAPIDKNLSEFQEKVTISKGVLTVVDRKFGRDSLSEGSVISLAPLKDDKEIELLVVSIPSKSKILLDNNQIGETPLLFKDATESDHVLEVTKEGYKDKTIRIRTPLGYKLTVAVYLSTLSDLSNAPIASTSASPTPAASKVTILDTPTGFLRVRASNSVGSSEIAQVAPSEAYEILSEETNWFQIKLKDGKSGWISSQYARKQ